MPAKIKKETEELKTSEKNPLVKSIGELKKMSREEKIQFRKKGGTTTQ